MPEEVQQPASQPQIPNKPKKTKSFFKFILIIEIIIILLGLAFGGYLYTTKDKTEALVTDLSSTENVDTSDWKTYENSELGASFQHPPDWEVEAIRGAVTLSNQDFLSEESTNKPDYSEQTPLPEDFIILDFTPLSNSDISQLSEYSTAKAWFNDLNRKKEKAFKVFDFDINSAKNITIIQQPNVVVKTTLLNTDGAIVYIQEEDNVFMIVISPYERIEDKNVLQILSTFKAL